MSSNLLSSNLNSTKQTATFNLLSDNITAPHALMARQHSVVNFMRDNHCYEFYKVKEQKEHAANEDKKLLTAEQTRKLREK